MTTTQELQGYLEGGYLESNYQSGLAAAFTGMQVHMLIVDREGPAGMQAAMEILDWESEYGMQAEMIFSEAEDVMGMQAMLVVNADSPRGMQANMITTDEGVLGMMANLVIGDNGSAGMEVKADTLRHALHDTYLVEGYLEESYLAARMCAFLGMQVEMRVLDEPDVNGMQVESVIKDDFISGMQTLAIIQREIFSGFQADMIRIDRMGFQATMVIYNVTQLRLLASFPSRGTTALGGDNWTASSTAAGDDFGAKNLNTDIVEQVFRSVNTAVTLTCDTGISQGTTLDTIAILGHNLTSSAVVQVQGDKSSSFASPDVVFNLQVEVGNMYYIAPSFPTGVENQNRYWRFIINDHTNPDGYVQIGTLVFGNSDIFTRSENFQNPIVRRPIHFKDEVETEGFTNVMNDRSLKETLKLRFDKLRFESGNFGILRSLINNSRTAHKVLVIPTPQYPSRHAVFAKLVELPEISHEAIDEDNEYVTLDLEWDESR